MTATMVVAAAAGAIAAGAAAFAVWHARRMANHLTGYAAALGEGLDEALDRLERLQFAREADVTMLSAAVGDEFDDRFGEPQSRA